MALSTNSIIHYTGQIENLKKIIDEGFRPFYCYEKVYSSIENGYLHAAFPIISFCDIPLSQVKNHLDSYGYYGIGLTKEWAKNNGLNPVLYFDRDSEILDHLIKSFKEKTESNPNGQNKKQRVQDLIKILSFSKNYEGENSNNYKNLYRFYDEREWRYVPKPDHLNSAPEFISYNKYKNDKKTFNEKLNEIRLSFEAKDITYLIVENEESINDIRGHLKNVFDEKVSTKEMDILMTKIMTIDQIKYDF